MDLNYQRLGLIISLGFLACLILISAAGFLHFIPTDEYPMTECKAVSDPVKRDACIVGKAAQFNEPGACVQISDYEMKRDCVFSYASKGNRGCRMLSGYDLDLCSLKVLDCDTISDYYLSSMCYNMSGQCTMVKDEYLKNMCLIRLGRQDASRCGEISDEWFSLLCRISNAAHDSDIEKCRELKQWESRVCEAAVTGSCERLVDEWWVSECEKIRSGSL